MGPWGPIGSPGGPMGGPFGNHGPPGDLWEGPWAPPGDPWEGPWGTMPPPVDPCFFFLTFDYLKQITSSNMKPRRATYGFHFRSRALRGTVTCARVHL